MSGNEIHQSVDGSRRLMHDNHVTRASTETERRLLHVEGMQARARTSPLRPTGALAIRPTAVVGSSRYRQTRSWERGALPPQRSSAATIFAWPPPPSPGSVR